MQPNGQPSRIDPCLGRRGCRLALLLLSGALLAAGLAGCGDCESTANDWKALVERPDILVCTADIECLLVGQTSTCNCSKSMAGDGVAVNGAAYGAAGGDAMLERFMESCASKMPVYCCDCAPMSDVGCVNGKCAIVHHGCCGGCARDGGAPWSRADASNRSMLDAALDVSLSPCDAY